MNLSDFQKFEYVSFDVFDTLITRAFSRPHHVFHYMEQRYSSADEAFADYANRRVQSELAVRRRKSFQEEVTLGEIYEEVYRGAGGDKYNISDIMEKEIACERDAVVVNGKGRELVKRLRQNGKKIVFISDTYLPEAVIEEFLRAGDIMMDGDSLFVSSKTGTMKSNGRMFQDVLKSLGISPQQICHLGDNKESDVKQAKKIGLTAFHYQEVINNRYENYSGDELNISRLVSVSKSTRLQNPEEDEHRKTIWDVTSGVSGPLVFFFVFWTLSKAVREGISHIYYLSRDGQIMHKIAELLVDKYFKGKIEVSYLYVSRQALLFPAIQKLNDEAFEWIMAPTQVLTPKIVLRRVNVRPSEIFHLLRKYGFHDKLDSHLSMEERQKFKELLLEAETFLTIMVDEYRERVKNYFHQEGVFLDRKFAVVDIGWSGTLQRSISRILNIFGKQDTVYGMYFGLRARKKFKDEDSLYAWFTDFENPRELDKKTYIIPMTEVFTAADHGGVKAYSSQNDKADPILMSEKNTKDLQWGLDVQHRAILKYTECLLLRNFNYEELEAIAEKHLDWLERNYSLFLLQPSVKEAETFGKYMIAEDQNESYSVPLAKSYSFIDMLKGYRNKFRHHHNEWREGAVRLTFKWF